MHTISTIFNLAQKSLKGVGVRNIWMSFLLVGLISMGYHRNRLRKWYLERINALCSNKEDLILKLRLEGKIITFAMRANNEADYQIGGELVSEEYERPDFSPEVIIDGGANIGMFTVMASVSFPNARLVCYEPDSANLIQLRKNLVKNKIDAEVHQVGLWSRETTIYYHPASSQIGYVDETPPGIPILCTLPKIEQNCWLKLDIEGSEYEVLPALFEHKSFPRWISMEIHSYNTKGERIINLLEKNGYHIRGGENLSADCTVITAQKIAE